jgi:hypothetical protein
MGGRTLYIVAIAVGIVLPMCIVSILIFTIR